MATAVAQQVENHIRTKAFTKRIRPSEFFLDFDRLRSGYVTDTQFFRVLWENLGIQLTDEEQHALADKYALKRDGRLNYRVFCNAISQPFNSADLLSNPASQATNFLGTGRGSLPLSAESEKKIHDLLTSLHSYYQYRGINLRTSCEDFDKHHIGVIQESQFYRSFPRPPEVTAEDLDLVASKYRDPNRPGLLNYLSLHQDLQAIGRDVAEEEGIRPADTPDNVAFLPPITGIDDTLQGIFDRMRVSAFRNRVRAIEFFKDYDKLRTGVITENQFVCGLSLAIGKEAQLTRPEIQKVVEYYRTPDGRVRYKDFTDMMDNAFTAPDLEKNPTLATARPAEGALGRKLPTLTEQEEGRLAEVLAQISDVVRKRRLMMYQYFKDYDRSKGYSRVITATQFARILHFLSLNVAPEDFKLLSRKFADVSTGDINYPAFVQMVDHEFLSVADAPAQGSADVDSTPPRDRGGSPGGTRCDLAALLALIRHHALSNRRRVCEYFQDFDPLRSGFVTQGQFRRGLSNFGLSALGKVNLTEGQFQALCDAYRHPKMADHVLWTAFKRDIESGPTPAGLEGTPTALNPLARAMDGNTASLVDQAMDRLRQRADHRRLLAKPVFQDFDKHNNHHVTRGQFRQCLTMLELHISEAEMDALEARFCTDNGFHYMAFLQELQPTDPPQLMYLERLKDLRLANEKGRLPEPKMATCLEGVLDKIKTKVFKERPRIIEWMRDYDKLRSGRITNTNFRRALDLCTFELTESELSLLEDQFQAAGFPGHVDYVSFSDSIESIFTVKGLEKDPMRDVPQFKPPVDWEQNVLEPELESLLLLCLKRLAEKVRKNRVQLFPLFEDYDRVHNGTVSRSQFRRVLSELELASLVPTEQLWTLLWHKFDVKVGGKDDVNYIVFCDMIYDLARFEWRKP